VYSRWYQPPVALPQTGAVLSPAPSLALLLLLLLLLLSLLSLLLLLLLLLLKRLQLCQRGKGS